MSKENVDVLVEIFGMIGSIEILLAYGLNSYQKIRSDSRAFILLNLTGAFLLMGYSFYKDAYANIFLNLVWGIVAVVALAKYHHGRTANKPES